MPDEPRRYSFHPLERRGVLLGLQGGQVGTLIAGVAGALIAAEAATGPAGLALAVIVLGLAAAATFWPWAGRPWAAWLPVVASWSGRRRHGAALAAVPGQAVAAGPLPAGIDLVEVPGWPGQEALGVIRDRRYGTWAAIVPVQGRSFVLLDADEQVGRLESWRAVLGTLARPGTPLRRIQWIHRSTPAAGRTEVGGEGTAVPTDGGAERARLSYRRLVSETASLAQSHQAWLILAVAGAHRLGSGDRTVQLLRREIRLLDGHLRNADLQSGPPLQLAALRELIAASHQRHVTDRPSRIRSRPWAMATDESWSALRADGTWHATFWISEWPRIEVNPDFLTNLLLCNGWRTVSVVMAPVPADRAARDARAARVADVADEELRARAGFLPNARRDREAEGVLRRETELADGHAEYRFAGYITVTAANRDDLEAACVQTQQAAQRAHLELSRLYGRQAEAFTWTLPLGRGLA
jgi:hypothetical protein